MSDWKRVSCALSDKECHYAGECDDCIAQQKMLIDILLEFQELKEINPDLHIYIEVPGDIVECRLGDANIYVTTDGKLAIDAE